MHSFKAIALLFLFMFAGQGIAQELPGKAERAKLQFLVGSFATESTVPPMPMAPKGASGKGTSLVAWALDSTILVIDDDSQNNLFGHYKGHGVLGFDAPTKQFRLEMFNNFGDHISYLGSFVADTLEMTAKVLMPKMPFNQKLLWYKEEEGVRLKVLNDVGKGLILALDQKSVPVSAAAK